MRHEGGHVEWRETGRRGSGAPAQTELGLVGGEARAVTVVAADQGGDLLAGLGTQPAQARGGRLAGDVALDVLDAAFEDLAQGQRRLVVDTLDDDHPRSVRGVPG